ncbi:MAG: DUF1905 domain-containing protein [Erysipelotrichaceae bacterium]
MKYSFTSIIYSENNRSFIKIPFNVWEETGLKGNIPCRVAIDNVVFECKLIPKGNGDYLIPVTKKIIDNLQLNKEYDIEIEPLKQLSRINHNSPYSKEHPVRAIDKITPISIENGLCGQCCISMLTGVKLDEVIKLMGKSNASWSKILEALDYYGLSYSKAVYTRAKEYKLPYCCIVNNDNRFILWYKDRYYGFDNVEPDKTVSYIEILNRGNQDESN